MTDVKPPIMTDDCQFDPELIARYDVNGPRYTSYPTAVQFSDRFSVSDYAQAVQHSNGAPIPAPLSLYVHIPFCQQLCFYCACNKIITQDSTKAADYLNLINMEAASHSQLLDTDREVRQLHLGGGSPTFMDDLQLQGLVRLLSRHFKLSHEDAEWSVEVDPRTVTASRMHHLAALGFNRISFGIQDIDDAVQVAVNRVQSLQQIKDCMAAARKAGMRSISVDLIYGLPLQTVDSFSHTLDVICRMAPDRIAIYNYAHLPQRFKAQRLIREQYLPSVEDKLAIQGMISERLLGAGYRHIGMDHYALPDDDLCVALADGTLQRNFQGYSTHGECELIGLGVSAISSIGGAYAQNEHRFPAYRERVLKQELPICRGMYLSDDDHIRAEVIAQIMCQMEINKPALAERYNVNFDDYFAAEIKRLDQLIAEGLLTEVDGGYQVTRSGRYLLRNVAMCFDRYANQGGNFSRTI